MFNIFTWHVSVGMHQPHQCEGQRATVRSQFFHPTLGFFVSFKSIECLFYLLLLCVCMDTQWAHMDPGPYVEVREQLCGVGFFLLPYAGSKN